MKIIRLSAFLDYGGIESKMANLSLASDPSYEWVFAAIGKGGAAADNIIQNGKKVEIFNLPHKIPSVVTLYKLYLFFKREKPDVVHTSGAEANFHGVIAAKLAGVPKVIAEEIGIPNHNFKARLIFKQIFKFSDYVAGESEIVCDFLKRTYNVSEKKLKIVPNFMVFRKSSNRNQEMKGGFHIVSVSRLEPVKNLEGLIVVVEQLQKENILIKFTIVGDGSQKEELRQLCKAKNLDNYVQFAGFQSNPVPFLNEADLFVLNSHTEGFSNALLEAMCTGTPSLSTKVGAAPEIIEEGRNGWLTEANDAEALFKKIKTIIGMDSSQREQIGQNAIQTVAENYSLKKHLENLMQIYTA